MAAPRSRANTPQNAVQQQQQQQAYQEYKHAPSSASLSDGKEYEEDSAPALAEVAKNVPVGSEEAA